MEQSILLKTLWKHAFIKILHIKIMQDRSVQHVCSCLFEKKIKHHNNVEYLQTYKKYNNILKLTSHH